MADDPNISDDDLASALRVFDTRQPPAQRRPASAEDFMAPDDIANRDMTGMDVVKGFGKGAARSVAGLVNMAAQSRMVPGLSPETLPSQVVDRYTPQYTNQAQKFGGAVETVAEMALPVMRGASAALNAIPRKAQAMAKFADVSGAAGQVPIDISGPGNVALRIQELSDAGASMPQAVRKFLLRVTNPEKAPIAYDESRLFASNISRLSANEKMSLTPTMAREVAEMRMALNKANGQAAAKVGKGKEYAEAMNEYGKAMRLRTAIDDVVKGTKRALPVAGVGAGAYWLTSKISKLLGGD